jgi:dTDP-glucose 4,6-dehydratase/UDP-glucuronate decarboxylase
MVTGRSSRLSHLEDRSDITFVNHNLLSSLPSELAADWIIHGASIASPPLYRKFPLETIDANVSGTRTVLEHARWEGTKGVLLLSSSEVYGDPDPSHIPTSEEYRGSVSPFGPRACYDESKRMGETLGYVYSNYFEVPITIIRPFNVFGPGQRLDDGRIIPDIMTASLQKKAIKLLSDGTATRSFCYVSDFVEGLLTLLLNERTRGQIYNLGNDEIEISIRDLAQRMCVVAKNVYGKPAITVETVKSDDNDYTTDNPRRRCPDLGKVKEAIGYQPKINLDEGLHRTLLSHLENFR